MKLGKMKEVDVRSVWSHEQYDFSKWLATEENMQELGKVLNLSLTEIETEKSVGNYRCDILCKDELTGKTVLIENQLETTNHDHLGKLITYASGLDASVVVWVVADAREEHASAIEWLNKYTTSDVDFFLLEIHVYAIGDSSPAPMFRVVEQPNDFAKMSKTAVRGEWSESQTCRYEFWNRLNDALDRKGRPFNKHKASTDHWYSVSVGSSQCHISMALVNKEHKIRVGFWTPDNKEMFDELSRHRNEIETSFGAPLKWDRLDGKKAAVISSDIPGLNFGKQDNYPQLIDESIERVVKLREAVKPFLD